MAVADPDAATTYAGDVCAGRIVAGEIAIAACRRHLDDLAGSASGRLPWLRWDPGRAGHAFDFFSQHCHVQDPATRRQIPFALAPWQVFCVGSLFGWVVQSGDPLKRLPGTRRFRRGFIETGKGSGKSPLAAGVGLYMVAADGEAGAEGYCCATSMQQAMITWRDAEAMRSADVALTGLLHVRGGSGGSLNGATLWSDYPHSCSLTAIASKFEGRGLQGFRPHVILVDEYHEHLTSAMLVALEDGTKGRSQPLTLITTNAGAQRIGPCWEEHGRAIQIARQQVRADDTFAIVYGVDEGDAPLESARSWPKACPGLGTVIREDYLLKQIGLAGSSPSRKTNVLRLNFGIWPGTNSDWLEWSQWRAIECDDWPDERHLRELPLYAGLDLADQRDMTSLARAWVDEAAIWLDVRHYIARGNLERRAEEPEGEHFRSWEEAGWLETSEGMHLSYDVPAAEVARLGAEHDLRLVVYDRYHAGQFGLALDRAGVTWHDANEDPDGRGIALADHPQGWFRAARRRLQLFMPQSIQRFEELALRPVPGLRVRVNPVLRWNLACVRVRKNAQGAPKFDKSRTRANGSIDGIVAAVMAVGAATAVAEADDGLGEADVAAWLAATAGIEL